MNLIAYQKLAQNQILPVGKTGDTYKWEDVGNLIHNVTVMALDVAGGVAMIFIIIGAIKYFTAYGDEQKAAEAKKTILAAIIGAIIIILSRVIVTWIFQFATKTPPTF